jgi:SSS family solute:Na+ symporter
LMPAIVGVCFPMRRTLTRTGVLAGLLVGLAVLYVTLVVTPHPFGLHGGVWALLLNTAVAVVVSAVTEEPTEETLNRIHGELERQIYPEISR